MAPQSPAVAQWEIAVRIRARRKELGLDAATVSKAVGVTRNYWSAVENDRTILAREKLVELAPVLEFDDEELARLLELNETARAHRWWSEYDSLHDDDEMKKFFGLEYGASAIQIYESQLVTGLLQIEDYTRALVGADPTTTEVSVRQRLRLRKQRQRRLTGDDPLQLTLLMGEAAICQQYGGPSVLRRQLEHLVVSIDALSETLEVRVLPFTSTPLGMTGASTLQILEFEGNATPALVWREAIRPIGVSEDAEFVDMMSVSYSRALEESSLGRVDSRNLIVERAAALE